MSLSNNYPAISPSLLLDFAGTKQLDPRITFTRATTASYYDGITTAKAEENLFQYSQEFDNAYWSKSLVTVTANSTTAPDGTTTADSIVENSTATDFYWLSRNVTKGATATTYTFSVYALQSARTWAMLTVFDGSSTGNRFWFNLATGATGTSAAVGAGFTSTSYTSTASTNGFYRITCTFTTNTATSLQCFVHPASGDGVATMTGVTGQTGIIIWGAQLEQRSAVTAYTATTTQPITNYIPVLQTAASGVARFDHNPTTGESLGLLVEEQRTNLQVYSQEFDNAQWTKNNSSITANTIVAPDGTLTGDKLVENTSNNTHIIQSTGITGVLSTTYTVSFYLKAAERTKARVVLLFGGANGVLTDADLSAGTTGTATSFGSSITVGTSSITSVGNGWYRVAVSGSSSADTSINIRTEILDASGNRTYTGDGYSGIYIWGAQLEAGAFPTSYIPTTSSTVTRNADITTMTGTNFSSWFNNAEGTLFVSGQCVDHPSGFPRYAALGDGTSSNFIQIYMNASSNLLGYEMNNGGSFVVTQTIKSSYTGQAVKAVIAYKTNDSTGAADGVVQTTDTSCTVPTVNKLTIGVDSTTGSGYLGGTVSKLAYYPVRVTNAQLQALTTV